MSNRAFRRQTTKATTAGAVRVTRFSLATTRAGRRRTSRSPTRRAASGRWLQSTRRCAASIGWIAHPSATPTAALSRVRSTRRRLMATQRRSPWLAPELSSSPPAPAFPMRQAKPVSDSQHETSELMMPGHANNLGHVFGGVILSMMDKCAAIAALRHTRTSVVTASIDRVDFREPIHLGDLVVMRASVNYVGRTSMEVGVRVEAEDLATGKRRHTNSCYLTFVAVDRNGRPIEVPDLIPQTEDELRRHAAAEQRRRRRIEERQAEEQGRNEA
ncbi:MAG TPA: acyl-CoA thioesterase [Gemmatimonadaceae bacterium]